LVLDAMIALAVVLLLAAPALFTRDGFIDDWVNHLWLTWLQSRQINATGLPSLFIHASPLGVFYPNFVFYGGTLYAIGGYLMALTGAPVAVFVGMLTAAIAAAYLGTLWVARQAGVPGLAAHLPAIVVVSGAYYLSLAYGRGSWPELLATSAIPPMIGAVVHLIRRGASAGPVLILGIATVIWSGSHNLTLAWGAVVLSCLAMAMGISLASHLRTRAAAKRMALVVVVIGLGVMINGWFLLPDVRYAEHTAIGQVAGIATGISDPFSRPGIIFNPLRVRATPANGYLRSHFTELPVLVMAWIIAAAGLLWRRAWPVWARRLLPALALLVVALIGLLMDDGLWSQLPRALQHIQLTFRLQTYIVLAVAGMTIVALCVAGKSQRWLRATLLAVTLFGLASGVWQVWNSDAGFYPSSRSFLANRSAVFHYPYRTPPTWYVYPYLATFRPFTTHTVSTQGSVYLDPAEIRGDSTSQLVSVPAGRGPVKSNIASPDYLVSVRGLRVAGETPDGYLALDRPSPRRNEARLTVGESNTTAVRAGPWLTLAGLVGLLIATLGAFRSARPREARPYPSRRHRG
jgi:hypothetical protein